MRLKHIIIILFIISSFIALEAVRCHSVVLHTVNGIKARAINPIYRNTENTVELLTVVVIVVGAVEELIKDSLTALWRRWGGFCQFCRVVGYRTRWF